MIRGSLILAAIALPLAPAAAAGTPFSAAEQAAIFRAAGAERVGNRWTLCKDDERRTPATIENKGDLDGDGRPDAVVLQEGSYCYGMTGAGFQLVSKSADGKWKAMSGAGGQGIPEFLPTKGVGGWPDIEIGGPGFCFPVWRFNGRAYEYHRQKEYQKGACARR